MKKIMSIAIMMLLLSIGFNSCNKQDAKTIPLRNNEAAIRNYKVFAERFINEHSKYVTTNGRAQCFGCVIVSDVLGTLGGIQAGGYIGSFFGPYGSAVGATVLGFWGGYCASSAGFPYVSDIPPTWSLPYEDIVTSNPFEYYGYLHNEALYYNYNHLNYTLLGNGTLNYSWLYHHFDTLANNYGLMNDTIEYCAENWGYEDFVAMISTSSALENSAADRLDALMALGYVSNDLAGFMKSYLLAVETIDDYEDFVDFTLETEDYVAQNVSSGTLKNELLEALAIAKYSGVFWYNAEY